METASSAGPAHVSASGRPFPGGDPVDILAANSRSFRFAARFLPADDARRIAEVYAFCRHTDDLVDKAQGASPKELEERLDRWEGLARLAHAGVTTGLPLVDLPIGRMGRAGIPFRYAEELLRGMRMDIRPRRYRTLADLEVYAHRAAGVVGQWLAEMAGVRHPWALERAADLGRAMQITNILRDVGEDWAGRGGLPARPRRPGAWKVREEGSAEERLPAAPGAGAPHPPRERRRRGHAQFRLPLGPEGCGPPGSLIAPEGRYFASSRFLLFSTRFSTTALAMRVRKARKHSRDAAAKASMYLYSL